MLKQGLKNAGLTGRLVAHVMPWFNGDGKHPDVGYLSQEPWVVEKQLDCMQALEVDDVSVAYSGPHVAPLEHLATLQLAYQCQKRKMGFSLCLNSSMVTFMTDKTKATDEVLSILDMSEVQYMLSVSGPNVYEFDLGPNGVALDKVSEAIAWKAALRSKHTGFLWPEKSGTIAQWQKDLLANKPNIVLAVLTRYFNDGNPKDRSKAAWDVTKPSTVMESFGGNFWHDQIDLVKTYNPNVDIGIVLNDDQEGNEWLSIASALCGLRVR